MPFLWLGAVAESNAGPLEDATSDVKLLRRLQAHIRIQLTEFSHKRAGFRLRFGLNLGPRHALNSAATSIS